MSDEYKGPYIVRGFKARQYNDFQLNYIDLNLCARLLKDEELLLRGQSSDLYIAVWTGIIVKFVSCFGVSASRQALKPNKIFKDHNHALTFYYRVCAIRNKNVVHDENTSTQSTVVVSADETLLSGQFNCYTVVKAFDSTLYLGLSEIIQIAIKSIEQSLAALSSLISEEIKKLSPEEVKSFPRWSYDAKAAMFEPEKKRIRLD